MDQTVAIVGGGLVGSLLAVFLSKRGFHVDLYEMRPDPRTQQLVHGKSINLAMSKRGRAALDAVGLEQYVTRETIPMHARFIHTLDGHTYPVRYGVYDWQYLLSIDRRLLNETLLAITERLPNTRLFFNHKLSRCSLDTGELLFFKREKPDAEPVEVRARYNFVFGCDGAFSAVRREMERSRRRFSSNVHFIEHCYIELTLPANAPDAAADDASGSASASDRGTTPAYREELALTGGRLPASRFKMPVNYLHIWPREEFMLIALPNADASFTVTLFMPLDRFERLRTPDAVVAFFESTFPDFVPLIGREELLRQYFAIDPQPLAWVKCSPLSADSRVLLLGDAAHATVPFFGQGMNAGFEDCLILDELLRVHANDLQRAIAEFSPRRITDAHALIDLSNNNYLEMRSHVLHRSYLWRKWLDAKLHALVGERWTPLYSMVAFTRTPYSECRLLRERQDRSLRRALLALLLLVLLLVLAILVALAFFEGYHRGNCSRDAAAVVRGGEL